MLNRAIEFATEAHRGQLRKGSSTPYILHPLRVGLRLHRHRFSDELVVAGFLHDVVEDTPVTCTELAELFGERVAQLVSHVTERYQELPWAERKLAALTHLAEAPLEAVALKASDTCDNAGSMALDYAVVGEALWERFRAGRDQQVWYYRSVSECVTARLGDHLLARELAEATAAVALLARPS